jgi:hypothetical protein
MSSFFDMERPFQIIMRMSINLALKRIWDKWGRKTGRRNNV